LGLDTTLTVGISEDIAYMIMQGINK